MVSKPPPLRRSSQKQPTATLQEQGTPPTSDTPLIGDAPSKSPVEVAEHTSESDVKARSIDAVDELEALEELEEHSGLVRLFYSFSSCGVSMIVHLVGLLLLAYLTVPTHVRDVSALVEAMFDPRNEDDPVEFKLDTQIQISNEITPTSITSSRFPSYEQLSDRTARTIMVPDTLLLGIQDCHQ